MTLSSRAVNYKFVSQPNVGWIWAGLGPDPYICPNPTIFVSTQCEPLKIYRSLTWVNFWQLTIFTFDVSHGIGILGRSVGGKNFKLRNKGPRLYCMDPWAAKSLVSRSSIKENLEATGKVFKPVLGWPMGRVFTSINKGWVGTATPQRKRGAGVKFEPSNRLPAPLSLS